MSLNFTKDDIKSLESWTKSDETQHRKRKKFKTNLNSPTSANITLTNKFDVLHNNDENMEFIDNEDDDANIVPISSVNKTRRRLRIPAIVVYNFINEHTKTLNELRNTLSEDLVIRSKRNRLVIQVKNLDDYKIVLNKVKEKQVNFHTYSLPDDKILRLVLKGLPSNITVSEIAEELKEKNLEVLKVKQFTKEFGIDGLMKVLKYPVFTVDFKPKTDKRDVYKIRKLCYCLIRWERYENTNPVIQCFKCQEFGHVAKNCFKEIKCVICASDHKSSECTVKNSNNTNDLVCANCNGHHTASFKECPVYLKVLNNRTEFNNRKNNNKKQLRFSTLGMPVNRQADVNSTPSRKTYKEALSHGVRARNDNHNNDIGNNKYEETNFSFSSVIHELKCLFSNINYNKVMSVLKNIMFKIKKEKDSFSKMFLVVEGIFELFN